MYAKFITEDGRFNFSVTDNGGVEITDEAHAALFAGQSTGQCITEDVSGNPVLTDPPAPTMADLAAAAITKVRAMRVNVFATLAGIQSQALANGDAATARAVSGLQDSLKALPDIDLSKCKSQSDLDSAFVAAWAAIVAAAPANVATAFNGLVTL